MRDLTQGNIPKQLIIFSIPLIVSDLIQGILSVVDLLYVGKFLDYNGVASISVVLPIVFLLLAVLIGIGASTNILIAQAFGSKDKNSVVSVISNSLTITLIVSLVLGIIGYLASKPILKLLNIPQSIFNEALTYLQIYIITMPISALVNWFMGITRGLGNSRLSFYFSIMLLVGKIILTPAFIIGFYIIPPLGVAGSIVSTIFIEIILLTVSLIYTIKKYEILRESIKLNISYKIVSKFIMIGIPASLQMIIISLSATVLMGFISQFGEKAIAVFGIGNRIDQFAFLPALSIGMALTTISSQNLSANKEERVIEFLKWSILISFVISSIVVLIINIFPKQIFLAFSKDQEVIKMGENYLRIMSISYVLMGIVFSIQGIIRGAGDTLAILMIKTISMILVRVPTAYILSFIILKSPNGVWISFPIVMSIEIITSWVYFKSEKWKEKVVFKTTK